ncbi:tetraacyldisaccharide 4'-kinase [Brucella pseudogrignonensis]|uniref:Tetraacyldisaccharide 4'-kinase n=1 Tax=Brucella pseudogrignonensis TaxID=419475 RepID=A0A256G7F8_9HYPH|nr:tetraacyldisaccharide 4'-kinase [Brucella pseudogrignonensis]EMG52989.1 tetraacyldisaccharide 4'-kinase [Ochrobactrum sp. CDB2]MCM0752400.1 tetraacyldisaccharide 4'-kinase [Brucella pseudogrignonensis]NNV20235.1 tetraacyldisaccharide 4'-kinase [Brucella pseudogrignonensis]OYR23042.1 tetraacyldisaccharide 4'-kinase [Brucella pseudogrignonensis]
MASEAPPFWWDKPNWRAYGLAPLSWIYGAVAVRRLLKAEPPKVPAPVLCIGNFTVGGAGKTPTAIAFAKAAKERGLHPGIVSRGYGGNYKGLHIVDPSADSARHVGDEPLLLARHAPVALCPDRLKSALELHQRGCDFIIMDDGFQSARLHTDFSLLVVDSTRGIGNGKVIPAGPLRAPLTDQMRKTDAVLRIGKGAEADFVVRQASRAGRAVYEAQLQPSSSADVAGNRWLAFAGIGNPSKFFASVQQAGGEVAEGKTFPDHYSYQPDDIAKLIETAEKLGVGLITTAKDHVRLVTMSDVPNAFIRNLAVLDVDLAFERKDAIGRILDTAIERFKVRSI